MQRSPNDNGKDPSRERPLDYCVDRRTKFAVNVNEGGNRKKQRSPIRTAVPNKTLSIFLKMINFPAKKAKNLIPRSSSIKKVIPLLERLFAIA